MDNYSYTNDYLDRMERLDRKYKNRKKIEKNAKNEAYFFILSHNLLNEFAEFCKNYHSDDPHKDCLELLLSNI